MRKTTAAVAAFLLASSIGAGLAGNRRPPRRPRR